MPDFSKRSDQKEFLDSNELPFEDIRRNMEELNTINSFLGGHAITISGVKEFIDRNRGKKVWQIVELGSGGGDNLQAIKKWANKKGLQIELTGIDINKECVHYARSANADDSICYIHSDYKEVKFLSEPDLIFSSLFTHHFEKEQLEEMLIWMKQNSRSGFFINDLHRHPLAYYSILMLTRILSKSYLVKNDAPISVLRGFKKSDWQELERSAGIKLNLKWKWAFRWLVTYHHDGE